MKVEFCKIRGTWREVADAARTTINKYAGKGEPSVAWKRKMLLCEHSPIRLMQVHIKLIDIPSWVSVHLVRHKIGIEHWVSTQRSDRTGVDRNKLPQDTPVNHEMLMNVQALLNISKKRLCNCAADKTIDAWVMVVDAVSEIDPVLAEACVPECVHRGFCPEYKSCGFDKTDIYFAKMVNYRKVK